MSKNVMTIQEFNAELKRLREDIAYGEAHNKPALVEVASRLLCDHIFRTRPAVIRAAAAARVK
jgi:hypothetical protein